MHNALPNDLPITPLPQPLSYSYAAPVNRSEDKLYPLFSSHFNLILLISHISTFFFPEYT